MSQFLVAMRDNVLVFLVLISVIVFIHEMGHFLVARLCRVRVETFSIGFGPELFGWTGKSGTRWRVSALPLGGYVRMFGESQVAGEGEDKLAAMAPEERAVAYGAKKVYQRAAIAAAGPAANFIFAIVVLAIVFATNGQQRTAPEIGLVQPGSAAEEAGLKVGDKIDSANGQHVGTFQDLQIIVRMTTGEPVKLDLERDGQPMAITVQPRMQEIELPFGGKQKLPLLGVAPPDGATVTVQYAPVAAVGAAAREIWEMVDTSLEGLGQMVTGRRGTDQLSGIIGIAKRTGEATRLGFVALLGFAVFISVNLGLVNLFPIPLLDGGHLLFYGVEAVLGRPLGPRAQEYGFRLGLALVLALMILATGNDLGVWKFIRGIDS